MKFPKLKTHLNVKKPMRKIKTSLENHLKMKRKKTQQRKNFNLKPYKFLKRIHKEMLRSVRMIFSEQDCGIKSEMKMKD